MSGASLHRPSLVDSLIDSLRATIKDGRWTVGKQIPIEASLAEEFGVSRNTVREAVRVLVHTGMLETRQGAGTFVRATHDAEETLRTVERAELQDQLEVRLTLEADAARLAAQRRNDDDLQAMRTALDARQAAEDDLHARIRHDERFHLAVVQAAHNQALTTLYLYFAQAIIQTIEQTERDKSLPEPSQADHVALFQAIERRDPDAATRAARALLQPSLDVLKGE